MNCYQRRWDEDGVGWDGERVLNIFHRVIDEVVAE